MSKNFQLSTFPATAGSRFGGDNFQLSQGFTLIEMLVTIAIIAIVSGVVIVGISPQKRIQDAQDSRARQDVRAVASAVESCLSYTDPTTNTTNTATQCTSGTPSGNSLTGAAPAIPGAPFARTIPATGLTIAKNTISGVDYICVQENGSANPLTTWYYSTATGVVGSTRPTGC